MTSTVKAVRDGLNRVLDAWRSGKQMSVIYVGLYGATEAVLAPLPVWSGLVDRLAAAEDQQSVGLVQQRLASGAGAQPTTILELTRQARLPQVPIPIVQARGMPRNSHDLAVWVAALSDLKTIAANAQTASAVLECLGAVTLGRVTGKPSAAGEGVSYAVFDVDGLHAVILTYRTLTPDRRRDGRRGLPPRPVVELIAVRELRWFDAPNCPSTGLEGTIG
ncbi:hypothetical protein ACIOBK_33640 [Micromonospora chokoriensis]